MFGSFTTRKDGYEFADSVKQLLDSTYRNVILVTGGVYLFWQIIAVNRLTGAPVDKITMLSILVIGVCFLSVYLLPRISFLAHIVWQIGSILSILMALYIFRQPEIAYLFIFLPLMDMVTVGWMGGLIVECAIVFIVFWLRSQSWMIGFSQVNSLLVISGGVFAGILAWAATHALVESNRWLFFYYNSANEQLEDARKNQLELNQTQQDLVLANRELARLSKELKILYQVAEEARLAKEQFVSNVSHELRTPLNMIIGFSEMIPKSSQVYGIHLPQALLADISAIRRNSEHLSKLVDDVLDLSQISAGRMALNKDRTSVYDILEEARVAVSALYDSKKLYLETEIDPSLPEVFWDATRMRQVVLNLLSNAGRFTKQGGVKVKAVKAEDDIIISVSDTGPGIAQEEQKRLFEPFQQLDNSIRRQYGGSGLGLNISKHFVEMHGGTIWLESQVGEGTTFYCQIPIGFQPSSTISASSTRWFSQGNEIAYRIRSRPSKAQVANTLPRYIVVEKGKTLRRLMNRYYQNVEVVSVTSIEEADKELDRSPASALLINSPTFDDSISLSRHHKKSPFNTPIFNCWIPGEDEFAAQLGVRRYLVKPVTLDILLSTLDQTGSELKDILLIDDNIEELHLISRILQSVDRGYRIIQANQGKRGLSLMRQRHPDIVILDLVMPGMDGFQVLHEINQDESLHDIPVIIMSSRDPSGEPLVSDQLTIMRNGGLSIREVLQCFEVFSEILNHPNSDVESLMIADREP